MKSFVYICSAVVALFSASVATAGTPPPFLLKWGSSGSGAGQFSAPIDLAVSTSGFVYVVDQGNNRVEQFTTAGTFLRQWGSLGNGEGQFDLPAGIAVDQNGFVYVTDKNNHRIEKFTSDGTFVLQWGSFGLGPGQFEYPDGIAVSSDNVIYVVHGTNSGRLQRFRPDGSYLQEWQTGSAMGCAVGASGLVCVSYPTCVIQTFTFNGGSLSDIGTQNVCGSGNAQLYYAYHMAVGTQDKIFVAEYGGDRIHVFSSTNVYLYQWGTTGTGDGQFVAPKGVALDQYGNVYVADTGNNRVQVFGDGATPTKPTSWGHLKSLYR